MRVIGFTGTRDGMTALQREQFVAMLIYHGCERFHHGACVGADEEAVEIVREAFLTAFITAHPGASSNGGPNYTSQRAIDLSDKVEKVKQYYARNRDIVHVTQTLFATPMSLTSRKGGTWMTIDYATSHSVGVAACNPIHVIGPDGRVLTWQRGEEVHK